MTRFYQKVFLTSPWVPAEFVRAYGLTPYGLYAAPYLPGLELTAGVCAFAQGALAWAVAHPESVVVFASTCDQLRRAFDATPLKAAARIFLFNIPVTHGSNASAMVFQSELQRLGHFFQSTGCEPSASGRMASVMAEYDRKRKALLSWAQLCSPSDFAGAVAEFHWSGDLKSCTTPYTPRPGAVPIALLAGPFCASHHKLVDWIEEAGGVVALNGTDAGERTLSPSLPAGDWSAHPQSTLAEMYLSSMLDVFQRPNTRLYSWLRTEIGRRAIRGIVLLTQTGCDLWRAEVQSLREAFRIPVLVLEADENPECLARETGRLEAFLEMLL